MAGYGIDGYESRIPCPHCGSKDCCGIKKVSDKYDDGRDYRTFCIATKKIVSHAALARSAEQHGIAKER